MAIIKCKMCGGDVTLAQDKTVGICEYCGSTMTFPKVSDEQRAAAFNRGNAFRRAGEFDKALAVYERIVAEDDTDAEAHWCCALCRFGIEWVEDPNTLEYVPTCHRASFDSFLEDVDYKAALEHSDGVTRRQYRRDGARINEVQRGILATSRNEKPFDVFICYKELDDEGRRTRDSIDAQEIYYNLTQEGYRVFFSRITLEDKVGTEYEPYIFAALNSAKVMVVIGSKPEYFNAVWVKNEWSRFLTLMHKDRSKLLLPCYKNMDPYDLPDQLSVLMSYDMTKIGFMQDLLRGIRKVLKKDEPKPAVKETVVVQQSAGPNVDSLLQRAFIFLEDGDWQSADEYCERVLDQAPKTALAYLGKLMIELKVSQRGALREQEKPFDDKNNYQRAIRFGDEALREELEGYNAAIRARIEEKRLTGIYNEIQNAAQRARTESEWLALAGRFEALGSFQDALHQADNCRRKAETARKAAAFDRALAAMNAAADADTLEETAKLFDALPGFRDAEKKAAQCREKAEALRKKAEEERLAEEKRRAEAGARRIEEEKRRAEEEKRRAEAEERRRQAHEAEKARLKEAQAAGAVVVAATKKRKATPILVAILVLLLIGGGIFVWKLPAIRQELAYREATETLAAGDYEAALAAFTELGEYKDSVSNLTEAKYQLAAKSFTSGDYDTAITVFTELGDYKDSAANLTEAKYQLAAKALAAGDYATAITAFIELGDYKDSAANLTEAKYLQAVNTLKAGDYDKAIESFTELGDYKDSAAKVDEAAALRTEEENAAAYANAEALLASADYENAIEAFMALGDYADSAAKADEASALKIEAENAAAYAEAETLLASGEYKGAILAFYALGNYLDSHERADRVYEERYIEIIRSAAVGDTFFLGTYEQDNDESNGPEKIEWIVLAKEDDRLLVLSKYALDFQQYNTRMMKITWDSCSLRKWLNDSFLNTAFREDEKANIPTVVVSADKNPDYSASPGIDTRDRVFLLSIPEFDEYYSSDAAIQCKPTAYAKSLGCLISEKGTCWWWLRSPGGYASNYSYWGGGATYRASLVTTAGSVNTYGYTVSDYAAIRPAMWIEIKE